MLIAYILYIILLILSFYLFFKYECTVMTWEDNKIEIIMFIILPFIMPLRILFMYFGKLFEYIIIKIASIL